MSLPEKLEILGGKQQSVDNRCAHIEDLLSANESLLGDVFESIQDGIIVLDTDFIIRRVNGVMNRWYGKHVPLEGNKCHIIYYNRDKPCDFCPALRCLQSGKTEREIIPGPPESPIKWIELYCFPIKDRDTGIVTGAVEYVRDITGRTKAEQTIRESEKQYRDLFDNANDLIQIVNADGRFLRVNRKWKETLGYGEKDSVSLSVWDIIHPDEIPHCQEVFKKIFSGEKVGVIETTFLTKEGMAIPVEGTASCSFSYRKPSSTLAIFRDISERKQVEDEKTNLKTQLIRAQKLEAIGTLAGGIAHDFNNLLMSIQGNASLMLDDLGSSDPKVASLINIENAVQSGAKLTQQLLGYARKGKYVVRPICLNQIIRETTDAFSRTRKEISIHCQLDEGLSLIDADEGQMEQIVLNLFVNASDAMRGGGDLILSTQNVTDEDMKGRLYSPKAGNYVKFTIADTGIGMDEDTQERIFDPFFTTKEMGRGTGLGLASVYGIIKSHGGYIDVDSEEGQGTTFSIFLPVSEKEHHKENKSTKHIIEGSGTILLVDDEELVIEVGSKLIKRIGYKVFVAKSGSEAIDVYKESKAKIDLVILDMIMPKMGGGETYDKMKRIDSNVKVLLSSGYSINGEAAEIIKRGCNSFIQKPFSMKDLSVKIDEVLAN